MTNNQNQFLHKPVELMIEHNQVLIGRNIVISENDAFDQVSVGNGNQFNEITCGSILESVRELNTEENNDDEA